MVFFRVTENINIKTTDGTLVKYHKLKSPLNLLNETIYSTTYEDFLDLKKVFARVDELKYQARVIEEGKITSLEEFPKELGIENKNEFSTIQTSKNRLITQNYDYSDNLDFLSIFKESENTSLEKQIKNCIKPDVSVAIIGNVGQDIGEMICGSTALRIFYETMKKKFKSVRIDLFLNASENKQFSRDKLIFQNQYFINRVSALSLHVKALCSYDFYIDTSMVRNSFYYKKLNYVDAWLYKFGIDFNKVPKSQKYNQINLDSYNPSKHLKEQMENVKLKGKMLFFHPYTASAQRTIPVEIALKIVKGLLKKLPDYTIVTALNIDSKFEDDRVVDFSPYSKSILDFAYIVSNMDKVITADTATYHISDAFLIPTVAIFTEEIPQKRVGYYDCVKVIKIEDKSKNLSLFNFDNESMVFNRLDSWKDIKVKQIIKLLA